MPLLAFCAWLTSLKVMFSSSIHLPVNDKDFLLPKMCFSLFLFGDNKCLKVQQTQHRSDISYARTPHILLIIMIHSLYRHSIFILFSLSCYNQVLIRDFQTGLMLSLCIIPWHHICYSELSLFIGT
jgi:hypothetical protein